MTKEDEKEIQQLLKQVIAPQADTELGRDLWPAMLHKLEARPIRVPWWDWALLAVAAATFLFFPGMIPALLYHL